MVQDQPGPARADALLKLFVHVAADDLPVLHWSARATSQSPDLGELDLLFGLRDQQLRGLLQAVRCAVLGVLQKTLQVRVAFAQALAEPLLDQQLKGASEKQLEIFTLGNEVCLAVQADEHCVFSGRIDRESPKLHERLLRLLSHLRLPSFRRR